MARAARATKPRARKTDAGKRKTNGAIETVDITPSPRILKVIAEIQFSAWQCIAELVDNSFDEFLRIKRSNIPWVEPFEVAVSLPSQNTPFGEAAVTVRDNGRGMTLDQVRNAVRAGYTGNDPISNLGLFGMGFNVATARVGGVTRFFTTREGDAEWIGVEIDIDNMAESFQAPVIREPKASPAEHGTRVEVRRLTPFASWLTRPANQSRLRKTLGATYSYLLENESFRLLVNTIPVEPWRHCVWDKKRKVTRGKEEIPAIIPIKKTLGERAVCLQCGVWQPKENTECEQCESRDLDIRERRVHGWLGIARNLSAKEYGIDFLRNGRKIQRFEKTIFQWRDPEDPGGEGEVEYPVEVPNNQGRIVGEIHLDHVRVSYTKDSFDSSDPAWVGAIRMIRGDGPLLPEKAKRLNYEQNNSPLARLHRGYRRNDPGENYLTPGNGKARLPTDDWVGFFHFYDPDYQTDKKWWEQVLEHERIVKARKEAKERGEEEETKQLDDPTLEFIGGGEEEKGADGKAPDEGEEPPLTEAEQVAVFIEAGSPLPELNGEFSARNVAVRPVKLRAFEVRGHAIEDAEGRRVPVWVTSDEGGGLIAFADLDHSHFITFDDEPEDIVLMEVAQNLLVRAKSASVPISMVFAELKERHLPSHAIDLGRLIPEATQLMHDMQKRMIECVAENPQRPWQNALVEAERHFTHERITQLEKIADVEPFIYSGQYLPYVPPAVVPRIIEEWPDAFLDEHLFAAPYKDVSTPGAKRQMVATITGYLNDIAWLTSAPANAPREQMIRARLSLQLLPDELV